MEKKKSMMFKGIFGAVMIAVGVILNYFKIGTNWYAGFESVGNWLVYVGLVSLFITGLQSMKKKEKLVDERAYFIGAKANRIVFLAVIFGSFMIMVLDGIKPITLPYHMFMSYLICAILLVYAISYKILEKYY